MTSDIRLQAIAAARPATGEQWPQITFESLRRWIRPSTGSPLLLGYCEDGLPLVLDLQDGHEAPILVIGDKKHLTKDVLKTLLLSAAWLPGSKIIGALVITASPQDYACLLPSGLRAAFVPLEPARLQGAIAAVGEYCQVSVWQELPKLLLVVDDMEGVRDMLHPEIGERLHEQILAGIPNGIVPILYSPWSPGQEQFARQLQVSLSPSCILTGDPGCIPLDANTSPDSFEMGGDDYLVWAPGYRKTFRIPVDLRSQRRNPDDTTAVVGRRGFAEDRRRTPTATSALTSLSGKENTASQSRLTRDSIWGAFVQDRSNQ